MESVKRELCCSICMRPVPSKNAKKCTMCGAVVCNHCCHHEKGTHFVFNRTDKQPGVVCFRCICIHQESVKQTGGVPIEKEMTLQWLNNLICALFYLAIMHSG